MELNKNRGVSSQKVAYLCSNSLTPSTVQRSGLLMGREQIGGCHLWSPRGRGRIPRVRARPTLRAPGSDVDLLCDTPRTPSLGFLYQENRPFLKSCAPRALLCTQ